MTSELGGVDAVLVFSAKIAGFELGLKMLRRGGLFVGWDSRRPSEGNLQLNPFEFLYRPHADLLGRRHRAGHARARRHGRAGAGEDPRVADWRAVRLPEIFDELEAGQYLGRAVITDLAG